MCEADAILRQFGRRLQQVHLSLVNSQGGHEPLNYESMLAFRRVSHLLPKNVPIILETPVAAEAIAKELEKVGWAKDLCAYCGKDDSFEQLTQEHFVPKCLWDDGHRPAAMKTIPVHDSCNKSFSNDDDYFRDILVFEEGAKGHPEVARLHQGPIRRKFEKRIGAVRKNLKNLGWYPIYSPGGVYLRDAPGFQMDWPRVRRVLQKIMKGTFYAVKRAPMPQDWLFTIPRPDQKVFDESAKLIESMVPWQSFGDDVFCCRYVFHADGGAMACLMAFYRHRIFLGVAANEEFHEHVLSRLDVSRG